MIISAKIFSDLFGYFCLELILYNLFLPRRFNMMKCFILHVGQDIDTNAAVCDYYFSPVLKKGKYSRWTKEWYV